MNPSSYLGPKTEAQVSRARQLTVFSELTSNCGNEWDCASCALQTSKCCQQCSRLASMPTSWLKVLWCNSHFT
eukprot:2785055-Amphidinium_carterae.1